MDNTVTRPPDGRRHVAPHVIATAGAIAFCALAALVSTGATQALDDDIMRRLAANRSDVLDLIMLDLTMLGDGVVLAMLTIVSATFLWLMHRRLSAIILSTAMVGGKLLNVLLKDLFDRGRPSAVEWMEHVTSPSFPSGHAMAAFVVYGAIAWLMGRLRPGPDLRVAIWSIAALMILLVGISRVYVGVHFPTDVLGAYLAGLAWLGLMAGVAGALRRSEQRHQRPAARRTTASRRPQGQAKQESRQ